MNSTLPPPLSGDPPPQPRLGLAIASLVIGFLGWLSRILSAGVCFPLVGLILGVAHLKRRQARNGMAWTGIGLCVLSICASAALGVAYYHAGKNFYALLKKGATAKVKDEAGDFANWVGVLAPDFSVTTLEGKTIKLSELKGKRVILNFWATWCPPCMAEVPYFIKLRSETPESEIVIVGISSEDVGTLKAFVKQNGINYPVASTDVLPTPYNVPTGKIPTTFFIDRKGVIQSVEVGGRDFEELKAHALADDYVGEPKPAPPATNGVAPGKEKTP